MYPGRGHNALGGAGGPKLEFYHAHPGSTRILCDTEGKQPKFELLFEKKTLVPLGLQVGHAALYSGASLG